MNTKLKFIENEVAKTDLPAEQKKHLREDLAMIPSVVADIETGNIRWSTSGYNLATAYGVFFGRDAFVSNQVDAMDLDHDDAKGLKEMLCAASPSATGYNERTGAIEWTSAAYAIAPELPSPEASPVHGPGWPV